MNENTSIRPGKIFLISDTHWFHERALLFGKRPPEFTQKIITQWQTFVMPQDTVIHLGDVIWGNKTQLQTVMNQLTGTKILVRGNHDKNHSDNWFKDAGFSFVCQKTMVNNILLSHMPSRLCAEDIEYGVRNIHGHFHNIQHQKWEQKLKDRLTDNHYLLALEMIGYKPVLLSEVFDKGHVVRSKDIIRGIVTIPN